MKQSIDYREYHREYYKEYKKNPENKEKIREYNRRSYEKNKVCTFRLPRKHWEIFQNYCKKLNISPGTFLRKYCESLTKEKGK